MSSLNAIRLSIMMFLQFFIWGAWYVTAPRFLGQIGFEGPDFGWTYSAGPIAAMISPFIVGMIADRFFSTERVLGVMHLLGGGAMFGAAYMMKVPDPSPGAINWVFFAYMLTYMPTLALTNSLALHNMDDPENQFPMIRVFGTIGWIVAGVVLAFSDWVVPTNWSNSIDMFYLAGGAAIVLGLYSFTLPHTPPPMAGKKVAARELLGADAFVLLKKPSFFVFMASSFLICIPLAFYYQMAERTVAQSGAADPAFKMTFGQMSEIGFMLVMPLFFARLGVKWMLFVGMLAWVVRYALFAIGAPDGVVWMLIVGVVLHGICYDFFFVTGQIYTDKAAPPSIRSQAQGMLVLFTLGLGMFIGAQTAGYVEQAFTPPESRQFADQAKALTEQIAQLESEGAPASEIEALTAEKNAASLASLQAIDWRPIWTIPAIGAAVVMVLFALLFHDKPAAEATEVELDEPMLMT
jgi:nucleoside transporter